MRSFTRRNFFKITAGAVGGGAVIAGLEAARPAPEAPKLTLAATNVYPGVVALDSFTDPTDDGKLTSALSYAGAQTRVPAIGFPDRVVTLSQGGRAPFSGMKLVGPGGADGPKNLELASGKYVNHKVQLNVGSGASAWFNSSSTIYDIYVGDLAFQGGAGAQFWNQPGGTLYACQFHALTFYGMGSVFGNSTTKALVTQVLFTGHWSCLGFSGQQFYLGGSDCQFWRGGYVNLQPPSGGAAGGTPCIRFDALQKTDVGYIYNTCVSDYTGVRVTGASDMNFFGGTFEGVNASSPSTRPVVDVQGGNVTMWGPRINHVNAAGQGAITQSGGTLNLISPSYERASAVLASYPLLYQTGGTAAVETPNCRTTGESVTVRWSDGTTQTLARANKTVLL